VTFEHTAEQVERVADPRVRRERQGDAHKLTAVGGLAALSLDAPSSVAYGPEAIVVALVAAGGRHDLHLADLDSDHGVVDCPGDVLAAGHRSPPHGGGAYAVAKQDLGRGLSLLAGASLVVDYVLTVAVSLAAGAASLASVFPVLAPHLLAVCLIGLVLLTAVNLAGIAESAKALMLPTLVFIISIFAIIILGLTHPQPVATIGESLSLHPTEAFGLVLVLKAFAAARSTHQTRRAASDGHRSDCRRQPTRRGGA
jgi:Amino acid permease